MTKWTKAFVSRRYRTVEQTLPQTQAEFHPSQKDGFLGSWTMHWNQTSKILRRWKQCNIQFIEQYDCCCILTFVSPLMDLSAI